MPFWNKTRMPAGSFCDRHKSENVMVFIVEQITWFIIEIVFWGIMFWTGYVLIFTVTLGQWIPRPLGRNQNRNKEIRRKAKFVYTATIGVLFWIGIGIGLTLIMISN